MDSKYGKKPVFIEAVQYVDENGHGARLAATIQARKNAAGWQPGKHGLYSAGARSGDAGVFLGPWIIKGASGREFYPCKADIFRADLRGRRW